VFCLVVCLAHATAPSWTASPLRDEDARRPSLQVSGLMMAMLAALQLVLGAMLRHTGSGLRWHVAGAVLLVLGCAALLVRTHRLAAPSAVRQGAQRLGGLVGLQVILVILALAQREEVGLITAHVALGALLLAQSVVLAWDARRLTQPRSLAVRGASVSEQVVA